MNRTVDYYKVLQVHHDAGQDIIDAAYRCLSKMYHPDVNKSPLATDRMKEINMAYSVIGESKKRTVYHMEWMRHNFKPLSHANSGGNRQQPLESDPVRETNEEAISVLDDFFCETVNERWERAYEKLTNTDKDNIPVEDFLEWKRAVASVYKLGNYSITYFRKYTNCDYAGVIYKTVFQFSIGLTEMQISNGRISEENTQKYVAFDGTSWRVCLGYTDLKPTIMKFKHLAQAIPKLDKDRVFLNAVTKVDLLTGLNSISGFAEQAEREILRSQRYGNPLTLAVITIIPTPAHEEGSTDNYRDACISYVAEILCSSIRRTDLIGRCNPSSFAILFTETKLEEAESALDKLLKPCDTSEYLDYKLYTACTSVHKGKMEQIIAAALENASLREKERDTHWNQPSDILSFNKKGKNHF